MEKAIDSVGKLLDCGKYQVYIASTAPWNNIDSLSHKRIWIERYFGEKLKKRLILTHRKDFLIGDYLIDDRLKKMEQENLKVSLFILALINFLIGKQY